jgi:hypothetical protein
VILPHWTRIGKQRRPTNTTKDIGSEYQLRVGTPSWYSEPVL